MKETPNEIHVKENFDDISFRVINLRRSGRGRPSVSLKQKYENKLPISEAKNNDLVSLCRSLVIPAQYHDVYTAFNTDKKAVDQILVPDSREQASDSDE